MHDTLHVGAGELAGVVRFYRVWRLTYQLYSFTQPTRLSHNFCSQIWIYLSRRMLILPSLDLT